MTPVALPELPKLPTTKLGGDGFAAIQMQAYAADYARLAVRMERERCAAICEGLADRNEQATADQRSREAPDEKEQLARLRHWSTVSTYNAGMKNCAAAIRNQP